MTNRFGRTCAAALAVAMGLWTTAARADVNWIIQSSQTPVTFSGVFGNAEFNYTNNNVDSVNGSILWNELYNAVPQTDAGTSYNGMNNSMISSGAGYVTTVGNNFLSTLNFGSRPANPPTYPQFQPTTNFAVTGNWLPNGPTGGPFPGTYGSATPAQAGFTLVGASGTNQLGQPLNANPGGGPLDGGKGGGGGPNGNGTAGRFQFNSTAGIGNSNGQTTPVTNGTFDASIIHFTGVLGLAANYQGDLDGQGVPPKVDHLTIGISPSDFFALEGNGLGDVSNNFSGAAAQGTITRSAGANSYQYIMSAPYQADIQLFLSNNDANASNQGTALGLDVNFTTTFHVIANLAKGDVNFDGVVNGLDIAAVSSNWLQSNAQHLGSGDANGDGVVNGLDIALISSNWLGTTPPMGGGGGSGSAVPEPSSWILLGLGSLGMWLTRRRIAARSGPCARRC